MPLRIMIAMSDSETCNLLKRLLLGCGFESQVASDKKAFLNHVRTYLPDVLLVDESAFSIEQHALSTLRQLKDLAVVITPSVPSRGSPCFEIEGPHVRRLATSWNSTELLNAIFETTYLGSREARVAQKAEQAYTSYGELKVLQ